MRGNKGGNRIKDTSGGERRRIHDDQKYREKEIGEKDEGGRERDKRLRKK